MRNLQLFTAIGLMTLAGSAVAANCPAVTVANMQGVSAGAFPQQYEQAEFEKLAGCTMKFSENPDIA